MEVEVDGSKREREGWNGVGDAGDERGMMVDGKTAIDVRMKR